MKKGVGVSLSISHTSDFDCRNVTVHIVVTCYAENRRLCQVATSRFGNRRRMPYPASQNDGRAVDARTMSSGWILPV